MDLPVVLIKFRDYIFWFGPAYLAAIALGAAVETILRRTLKLPYFASFVGGDEETPAGRALLYSLWWHAAGRPAAPQQMALPTYIWLGVTSEALSWLALLVTSALSAWLAVLRLGSVLIMASLLAALVHLFLKSGDKVTWAAIEDVQDDASPVTPLLKAWWQVLSQRFSRSSNDIVLAAALGAGVIGLAPNLYYLLGRSLAEPTGYLVGPGVGFLISILAGVAPGADVPLLAALQAKGVENWAILAVMLAVSASPAHLIKGVSMGFGRRAAIIFVLLAWLIAGGFALLVGSGGFLTGAGY